MYSPMRNTNRIIPIATKLYSCLYIIFALGFCMRTSAQVDTSGTAIHVHTRHFATHKLSEWRLNRQFQYDKIKFGLSWWERLKMRFWKLIADIFATKQGRYSFWSGVILLSIALIVFALFKLTGKGSGVWERTSKENINAVELEENIHEINFGPRIEEALAEQNYRLAIRLRYLYMLKLLSNKEWINWKPSKTYNDYCKELYKINQVATMTTFRKMGRLFDYAWYNDKPLSEQDYREMLAAFEAAALEIKNNKTETV